MKLTEFDLTQDPFPIVPDGPVHNWAGRPELLDDLLDLIKGVRARDIGVTEFGVLHGELGAGKSHALRFLKTYIEDNTDEFASLVIYLERPRVATKLNFLELYKYIIRELGRERIKVICQEVQTNIQATVDEIADATGYKMQDKTSFFDPAVNRIAANDRSMAKLLYRGATDPKVFEFLAGNEKCDGLEYEGKIDSDFIAAQVLADFFRLLTSEIRPDVRIKESVYLFIDETEIIFEAKTTESDLIFNGLRELINGLPYRFCMLMSFSAAAALIEAVMPQHLLKRLTLPYIEIPMLEDDQAMQFLLAQINNFRPPNSKYGNTYYPFDKEALQYIVDNQTSITPRNLFLGCKRVLERAIRRYDLTPGNTITRDTAESILNSYR